MVSTKNRNNLECALAEAAYLTGLERNADVVRMASYAPLFAHVGGLAMDAELDLVPTTSAFMALPTITSSNSSASTAVTWFCP